MCTMMAVAIWKHCVEIADGEVKAKHDWKAVHEIFAGLRESERGKELALEWEELPLTFELIDEGEVAKKEEKVEH